MSNLNREKLVEDYYNLKKKKKEIDDELEMLRTIILNEFEEEEKVGNFVVRVMQRKSRRLDTKKLRKYIGDEIDEFYRETEYYTVEVKHAHSE